MNKITILDHKECSVDFDDDSLFPLLRNKLSFRQVGVEHVEAFRRGHWDGVTYLVNNKRRFSLGLLDKVQEFMTENNLVYATEDRRPPYLAPEPIDLSKKLAGLKIVPRDYQQRVVDLTDDHRRGVIRACTSSGKTLIIAMMAAKLNKPCVIHVVGLQLLQQFHDTLSSLFEEKIGWIGNGMVDIQRINVASIWTLGKALNIDLADLINEDDEIDEDAFSESDKGRIIQMLADSPVHIVDECQFIVTNSLRSIYAAINPESLYGLSGTPYREDGTDLLAESILGPKIVDISASELIERGVIVQPVITFVDVPKLKRGSAPLNTYQQVYKNYIVENEIRNNLVIDNSLSLVNNDLRVLVLFKQIKHGNILADLCKARGIKYALLSGKDSLEKRNQVIQDFRDKKIDLILASVVFDIGVNIPEISGLILAGGGKASGRALQRIGRVIRAYPGKKKAYIVDFQDNVKFLNAHSKKRCETYRQEKGFEVIWNEND